MAYRSNFEAKIAKELKKLKVAFTYESYSYEYEEPLRKNRAKCGKCGSTELVRSGWYTPDFFLANGVILETKGRFTAADRRKILAVLKYHPELPLKLLFMRNNRIHKNSKTTYADWCTENGIDYSVGELKKEWL